MDIDKRMLEIMNSLEQSHEVHKDFLKESDSVKAEQEVDRLKKLISEETNADFKENINEGIAGVFGTGGRGKTVNSFVDDYRQMGAIKTPKVAPSNLKPDEALEICIKRVLKSGTPVNNVSFYDEVNWNLMNIGFPAVNEINIKNAILAMIS